MLSTKDLNAEEREGLEKILDKDETAWTDSDKAHLRARLDYLSGDDKERLENVTVETEEPKQLKAKPFNKMKREELEAELTAREIQFDPAAKNADLVALLEAASQE
jgi:hypothetical protein